MYEDRFSKYARSGHEESRLLTRTRASESNNTNGVTAMCSIVLMIGMAVMGIIALATGKIKFSNKLVVKGLPAYLVAAVLLLPFPVAFMVGVLIGLLHATNQPNVPFQPPAWLAFLELGITGLFALIAVLIAALTAKPEKKKKRFVEDDYDDDDDRLRRRRDNEDDDDQPRRRRNDDDDDDQENTRRTRSDDQGITKRRNRYDRDRDD